MITKLKLKNFKSFEDVEIKMGPVTTLIGTNASGKSNVKEALRLLHGISRGYTLAEAIGEKWVESGVLQWKGIRGGTREMVFSGAHENWCEIGIESEWSVIETDDEVITTVSEYTIRIELDGKSVKKPRVLMESFIYYYKDEPEQKFGFGTTINAEGFLEVTLLNGEKVPHNFDRDQAILSQLNNPRNSLVNKIGRKLGFIHAHTYNFIVDFRRMRFFDLSPDLMRNPSVPGQTLLSDRGENLSAVLYDLCENERKKEVLLQWVRELTPQDVADFAFYEDHQGKILVELVDSNGRAISAHSASDGTLRFLATVAALLNQKLETYFFFEEIENGIHPSRLHLLIQLMEQRSKETRSQIILSTHSPQLLGYLGEEANDYASLVYRTSSSPSSGVIPILEIPYIKDALQSQDVSEMHASGWFENVMEFIDPTDNEQEDESE